MDKTKKDIKTSLVKKRANLPVASLQAQMKNGRYVVNTKNLNGKKKCRIYILAGNAFSYC